MLFVSRLFVMIPQKTSLHSHWETMKDGEMLSIARSFLMFPVDRLPVNNNDNSFGL